MTTSLFTTVKPGNVLSFNAPHGNYICTVIHNYSDSDGFIWVDIVGFTAPTYLIEFDFQFIYLIY